MICKPKAMKIQIGLDRTYHCTRESDMWIDKH
jgi:hypothetical protein